jgi:DNA polymerase III delta prime subunit
MTGLITKYLPKQFHEFEIDSNIVQCLTRLTACDNLNVLLISRPGCGKTSLINTIVKTYFNKHPKTSENILTVNSVKEQGVSFYRGDVKTFCQSLPTIPGKKRVVILDDIDMINEQSQQLFRTCIDQFSKSVHFIASATDPQKVIESLQSRLLGINIPPLTKNTIRKIANKIIIAENISISDDALEHMINVSHFSARNLINYLEKALLLDKHIDLELSEALCTDISWKEFETYIDFLKKNDISNSIKVLYSLYDLGFSVMDILDNFLSFLKETDKFTQATLYNIIQVLCKHMIYLYDVHSHQIELVFFTRKVIKIISCD